MARATLATVKQITYENLGISPDTYGTLQTNKRYKSGYIDDAITAADIYTLNLLLKNKQNQLLREIADQNSYLISGTDIQQEWEILEVLINDSGTAKQGKEVSYGMFEELDENAGGIYDTDYTTHIFCIYGGKLYFRGDSADVYYVTLTHPVPLVTLKSPAGFEAALANLSSAILLEKRNDNPEQAKAYREDYMTFMQAYMVPDTNLQEEVESE